MNIFKSLFKEVSPCVSCFILIIRAWKANVNMCGAKTQPSFHVTLADETQHAVKDVITLFHSPSSPASIRAHTLLKQAAAHSQAHATEDQASSHEQQSKLERTEFNLGTPEETYVSAGLVHLDIAECHIDTVCRRPRRTANFRSIEQHTRIPGSIQGRQCGEGCHW